MKSLTKDLDEQTLRAPTGTEHRAVPTEVGTPEDDFDWIKLADEIRSHTRGRPQTPAEVLLRESRDER